jgi:hypothetical protein
MKIYNMLVMDKKCDPEIRSFASKEVAIKEATRLANIGPRRNRKYTIKDTCRDVEWVFCAVYTEGSDFILVIENELDEGLQ